MSTSELQRLVDITSQGDKDERWMATNDLCNILSSDRAIDEVMEQKVCNAVLRQLGISFINFEIHFKFCKFR
jgi:hypothetical protein